MACNTKKQIIFPEPLGGEEEIYTYCLVDSGQEAQEHKVISLHSAKKVHFVKYSSSVSESRCFPL